MAPKKDFYKTLGVSKNATKDEIKKAYRKLAKQYHPDLNPGNKEAEQRFKEIQEANEILSNDEKRKAYDIYGAADFQPGGERTTWRWSQEPPGGFDFNVGDVGGFEDLFGEIFGSREAPWRVSGRGKDIEYQVTIDFQTAIRGGSRDITISKHTKDGNIITDTINVKIPSGVDDRSRIRIKGKGEEGKKSTGDLYLRVKVQPHPIFVRKQNDIYVDIPVTFYEAVLGASVAVPTIDGSATLTIPSGVQSGTKLRLKGKGVENLRTRQRGDQYVVISVVMPEKINEATKKRFEEFKTSNPYNPRIFLEKYLR
ncbi:MAG: DnaJ C-terminal domain-containing protein [Thermodesulfobacteriota bacterium]